MVDVVAPAPAGWSAVPPAPVREVPVRHRAVFNGRAAGYFGIWFAGLVFGDASGCSGAVAIPATLLESGFSRGHEREADAYAVDLLSRTGRSPRDFAGAMRRLSRASGENSRRDAVVGYLSTHPSSPERIAAAVAAAAAGERAKREGRTRP